jgi:hypothetical protein
MKEKILLNAGPSGPGSFSRIQDFIVCPQMMALKRFVPRAPNAYAKDPLVKGSLIHIGLAHLYARAKAAQQKEDYEVFYTPQEALLIAAPSFGHLGEKWLDLAKKVVANYEDLYTEEALRNYKILYVEEVFQITINGRVYTQRPDLVVMDLDGRVWIWDHKSTYRVSPETIMRYTPSLQFLAYRWWGPMVFGERFGGVIVNGIQVNEPYVVRRGNVAPAPWMVSQFPRLVMEAEEQIARLKSEWESGKRGLMEFPKAASESVCMTAYGPCDFMESCLWGRPDAVRAQDVPLIFAFNKKGA